MPCSVLNFKTQVRDHIVNIVTPSHKILDVGAGSGTYANLLAPLNYNLYALEIYQPYLTQFALATMYVNVDVGDICTYDYSQYDYIIMGDVLEHIAVAPAQKLIKEMTAAGKKCLVGVPYMYPQGAVNGNQYEEHLQPDLTPDLMQERYPELKVLFRDLVYGYYINY